MKRKFKKKKSCCLSPLLPSGPPGEFRARSKDTEKQTKSPEAELEFSLRILKTDMDKAVVRGACERPIAE